MKELTVLEREVILAILTSLVRDGVLLSKIVSALAVAERSFSADALDKERCVGFFTDFAGNELLRGIDDIPHHLGVQASHHALPAGGDFILFFDQQKAGIKMLEASFFGNTLPIDELISVGHGFKVGGDHSE